MAQVRGIIFDVDGTLIDSNDAHAQSWVDVLSEAGHDIPFERVRPLIGMGGDHLLEELLGLAEESPEAKALRDRRGRWFRERYLPRLAPFDGARALLEALKAKGYRLVVGTSASADDAEALLAQAGVEDLFDEATNSDDVEDSKPDEDIIEAALEKLGLGPEEVLLVGDTPYDVEAARRAGVQTIAFRSGGWDDEDLAEAVACYDGPRDLLEHLSGSPLGD